MPITIDGSCNILVACAYSIVGHTSVGEASLSWHWSVPYSSCATVRHWCIILKQLISMNSRLTISWAGDADDITLTDVRITYVQHDITWFVWNRRGKGSSYNWSIITIWMQLLTLGVVTLRLLHGLAEKEKFLFECQKIFYQWVQRTSEILFNRQKEISYLQMTMYCFIYLLYQRQWNNKPVNFCWERWDLLSTVIAQQQWSFHMWR